MARELAPEVRPKVDGKVPYDIQEFCITYIRDEYELPSEAEERIKKYVYDTGLDVDDVLDVLAIALRDELVEED